MTFTKVAALVLRKDFAIELKSGEILYTTLFFAVSCVLIFALAFVKEGTPIEGAGAGILWIAVLFAGNLALGLRDLGLKIGLLDADIYGPSIPKLLAIKEKPETIGRGFEVGGPEILTLNEIYRESEAAV